ncbi:MAG TPA: NAD(P)H-dependent oxidoreductase, partial [Acholeplasmataceae bacterium]|nr:NAD(P)H-dependent oxidoreductase [Acholeplasmataceae bacterium]
IFALAEYNHSVPGVLKNALDYVGTEMANKAAAIVSYGAAGGALKNARPKF